MAGPFDFTGQNIEDSYQRVLQTDGTSIYDGTGSLFSLPSAFPYTGSARITGSLAVIGNQTLTGSILISGSNYIRFNHTGSGTNTNYSDLSVFRYTTYDTPALKVARPDGIGFTLYRQGSSNGFWVGDEAGNRNMTLYSATMGAFTFTAPGQGGDFSFTGGSAVDPAYASSIVFRTFDYTTNAVTASDHAVKIQGPNVTGSNQYNLVSFQAGSTFAEKAAIRYDGGAYFSSSVLVGTGSNEAMLFVKNIQDISGAGGARTAIFEHRFGVNALPQSQRYGVIVRAAPGDGTTAFGVSNQAYNSMLQGYDYTTGAYRGISLGPLGGSVVVGRNLAGTADDGAKFVVRGRGTTSATFGMSVENANGSASFAIRDDGRVGIGTTSPSYTLDVPNGNIRAQSLYATNWSYDGASNTKAILTQGAVAGDKLSIADFNAYVGTGNQNQVYIYNTGFTPSSGTGTFNIINLGSIISQSSGATGITRGIYVNTTVTAATNYRAIETTSGSVSFNHGSIPLLFASSSGKVGIGTLTPASTLSVSGRVGISARLRVGATGDPNSTMEVWGDQIFATSAGGVWSTFVQSTERLGVGTSSPSSKVHIKGSGATNATTALRVENTNTSASLVVLDNGFVGINTGSAQYNLDVNGTSAFRARVNIFGEAELRQDGITQTFTSAYGIFQFRGWSANNLTAYLNGWNYEGYLNFALNIGTGSIATPSAVLEVTSTTRGFRPPRTATTASISSPAQGLMTYLTGSTNEGLYYYNSGSQTGWHKILTNTGSQGITGSLNITNGLIVSGSTTINDSLIINIPETDGPVDRTEPAGFYKATVNGAVVYLPYYL